MDFESPDEYPGLFQATVSKISNDSDYSDDVSEKISKKDILSKRKEKKDKKERGYAALEGESSAEEKYDDQSPVKSKKSKSFKFSAKHKEKREKIKDREIDKKKIKDKKCERSKEKSKVERKDRKSKSEDKGNIGESLPIFSVSLQLAVERSHCHDGVDLPLPVRECLDYIQEKGINTENVYKISGVKTKVLQIKKLYNQREQVNMSEYDVPTATSVLKLFFRELTEPILDDLIQKFEEVASVQNTSIRETSFKSLIETLPKYNRTILTWTILHLDTIVNNHKINKMNAQSISQVLGPVLQLSPKLLITLLNDCKIIFKDIQLFRYNPPLTSSVNLPEDADDILTELKKQESLLSQIHSEMNSGFISKNREELLWEVQRMITQLKRKLRTIQKYPENLQKNIDDENIENAQNVLLTSDDDNLQDSIKVEVISNTTDTSQDIPDGTVSKEAIFTTNESSKTVHETSESVQPSYNDFINVKPNQVLSEPVQISPNVPSSSSISITSIQHENIALLELKTSLLTQIAAEKFEIDFLKYCLANNNNQEHSIVDNNALSNTDLSQLDEFIDLIQKENRILQIKKK